MYQVTIKGRTLEELKSAVSRIHDQLQSPIHIVNGMTEDLTDDQSVHNTVHATEMAIADEETEVHSKYTESGDLPATSINVPLKPLNNDVNPPVTLDSSKLDTEGVPWDERIHTKARTKVRAGTWKLKKGSDADVVSKVKAELIQNVQLTANPTPIPPAPITPTTPVVETPVANIQATEVEPRIAEVPINLPPPVAPPVVAAPIVTPPPVSGSGHTFETFKVNFPMIVGTLLTEGKVTSEYINELTTHFKVQQIYEISDEQKAVMFESFAEYGFIQKVG